MVYGKRRTQEILNYITSEDKTKKVWTPSYLKDLLLAVRRGYDPLLGVNVFNIAWDMDYSTFKLKGEPTLVVRSSFDSTTVSTFQNTENHGSDELYRKITCFLDQQTITVGDGAEYMFRTSATCTVEKSVKYFSDVVYKVRE